MNAPGRSRTHKMMRYQRRQQCGFNRCTNRLDSLRRQSVGLQGTELVLNLQRAFLERRAEVGEDQLEMWKVVFDCG